MLLDLTRDYVGSPGGYRQHSEEKPLRSANSAYTGIIHRFESGSMQGTYLDLPGHIKECDDGLRADNYPIEQLYRVPASLVRLQRQSGSGAVSAADLQAACAKTPDSPALIINALGDKDPEHIETRSVYLSLDAVDWIIHSGCRLLVSDIYESQSLEGVFLRLFQAGVCCVCEPVRLYQLPPAPLLLTVAFPKFPGLTQFPCRLLAEITEADIKTP